jgi:hypothetical protein
LFPYNFENKILNIKNKNIYEFLIKIIYNNYLINLNEFNKKKYYNYHIQIELKIFLNNNKYLNRDYKEINNIIDYNNIYLKLSLNNVNFIYKLDFSKIKKDGNISIRTKNIVNKYLFYEINEIIKVTFKNFNEIKISNLELLNNINLIDIIKEVIPNNLFFNSKFNPHIRYKLIKDLNFSLNKISKLELDFKYEWNSIEKYNLFELYHIIKKENKN